MAEYEIFKLNKDFRRLYGRGKCLVFPSVVVYYSKNNLGHCRMGITASKKLGCAVKRNRAKRVITAAFRNLLPLFTQGYDFVFVARVKTTYVKSTVIFNSVKNGLMKDGVLKHNEEDTHKAD
ncbi:MAG: ribonuclease P protein component [Clostridia bacterium]|nr:ribonuclease P protein component [Clostridia bacterium]